MQDSEGVPKISVKWRENKYVLEMNSGSSLKELGHKLQNLTAVKADTVLFIVPQKKGSKLLSPFSNYHSSLSLQEVSIIEGKPIRMMGVSEDEIDKVLQNEKADLRIVGFEEEERRLRQRILDGPHALPKLPQGPYIFVEHPPASEALKRMHMLSVDPGIVAVMNKHCWRVGIMTELAPVGYVGISPKCILGFNNNHGEEMSLHLQTDDLKGFRKYESIKKTLLHELAHMIYSEHDANFYPLDKKLNQETAGLDWTKSRGHTLSGVKHSGHYEDDYYAGDSMSYSQKLGGKVSDQLASARASSVAAAYCCPANSAGVSEVHEEPDPDDSGLITNGEHDHIDSVEKENPAIGSPNQAQCKDHEPDPDDSSGNQNKFEPDPDDSKDGEDFQPAKYSDPDKIVKKMAATNSYEEPDPDDSEASWKSGFVAKPDPLSSQVIKVESMVRPRKRSAETDPDDSLANQKTGIARPDHGCSLIKETMEEESHPYKGQREPDPDESQAKEVVQDEPDPDDNLVPLQGISSMKIDEPDPDDQEIRRIQDSVTVVCSHLQKAIEMLRVEVNPVEATTVLQTLFKIIRELLIKAGNICLCWQECDRTPDEMKYKRHRKANPIIQRNVANYKVAMEILHLVGFNKHVISDEIGKVETYLVLKRNDPGLLWLAKSSLQTCIAY